MSIETVGDLKIVVENNQFPKIKKAISGIISMAGMSYISGTNKILYNDKRMDCYCLSKFILKEPSQLTILKDLYENIHDENEFLNIINRDVKENKFSYKRVNHRCKTLFQETLYRLITTFYEKDKEKYSSDFIKVLLIRLKHLDNEATNFVIDIDKTLERYDNKEFLERQKKNVEENKASFSKLYTIMH